MKEQIKEIFEGMKADELQELKAYLGGLQKEIAEDFKRRTSEEISDEEKFLEIFSSLISVLGSTEIIKIIEEIERRKEEE